MSRRPRAAPSGRFDVTPALVWFGQQVKARRDAMDWTQDEVATRLGCTKMVISHVENARGWPHFPRLVQLCTLLDLPWMPLVDLGHSQTQRAAELLAGLPPLQMTALLQFLEKAYVPVSTTTGNPSSSSLYCEGYVM